MLGVAASDVLATLGMDQQASGTPKYFTLTIISYPETVLGGVMAGMREEAGNEDLRL